jgi:hypothetical protein
MVDEIFDPFDGPGDGRLVVIVTPEIRPFGERIGHVFRCAAPHRTPGGHCFPQAGFFPAPREAVNADNFEQLLA